MDNLPGWARIAIPKAAGFVAGLIVSWLTTKGITVTPENHEFLALLLVGMFTGVGGAVKWVISHYLNPANVNNASMANQVHVDMKAEKENGSN